MPGDEVGHETGDALQPPAGQPRSTGDSLRRQVYRSGRFLVARQLVGMAVKLGGILVVTRLIGPDAYGIFAAIAATAAVMSTVAVFGIDVQLVRAPSAEAERTATTILLLSSLALAAVGLVAAPLLGAWLRTDDAIAPMRLVAALLPLMVLAVPARARLERELRFGPLAGVDLAADLAVYVVSVPLAVAGVGVWAPIGGLAARHLVLTAATGALARYRPRPGLDRDELSELVRFGSGYSAGKWLSLVGQLVNPVVVGRLLGPAGVGQVALATRVIEQLGAVKQATMRLATAAFARLEGNADDSSDDSLDRSLDGSLDHGHDRGARLRAAYAEGVLVQVIGAVPLYAAAAFVAPWLLPAAFGPEWRPAAGLIGFLAVAASIGTLFNLGPPLLRVRGRESTGHPAAGAAGRGRARRRRRDDPGRRSGRVRRGPAGPHRAVRDRPSGADEVVSSRLPGRGPLGGRPVADDDRGLVAGGSSPPCSWSGPSSWPRSRRPGGSWSPLPPTPPAQSAATDGTGGTRRPWCYPAARRGDWRGPADSVSGGPAGVGPG